MTVNYKILFEVKLLHEYYLTEKDGSTVFDKPLQQDKLAFLHKKVGFNLPSIHDNIAFELSEPIKSILSNYKLRLINSYSGFKVFASVTEQTLTGGVKAYRPLFVMPDDLPIVISLNSLDTVLETISNSPIKKALPSKYYFTNRNLGDIQVYPILSRPLPLKDDGLVYEQGDLLFDPADSLIKAFFFGKNGSRNWAVVKGEGFVNLNDLSLLTDNFDYRFFKDDGVGEATFVLKNNSGTIISTITRTISESSDRIHLDFGPVIPVILTGSIGSNSEVYTLEVSINNGLVQKHPIVFCSPRLKKTNTWGLVHLQPRVDNSLFNLLDDDGLLITRKNSDGSKVSHPIFEIRVKSRFVFWKYINHKNEKILDNAALHPFLEYDASQGFFETKGMLNATYTPIEFSSMGIQQYLPNPEREVYLENERQRVYVKIRVPKSNLFKV